MARSPAAPSEAERWWSRPIVAFDFDGTLTTHDSFTAFLKWRAGPARYAAWASSVFCRQLSPICVHRDRGGIKAAAAA